MVVPYEDTSSVLPFEFQAGYSGSVSVAAGNFDSCYTVSLFIGNTLIFSTVVAPNIGIIRTFAGGNTAELQRYGSVSTAVHPRSVSSAGRIRNSSASRANPVDVFGRTSHRGPSIVRFQWNGTKYLNFRGGNNPVSESNVQPVGQR